MNQLGNKGPRYPTPIWYDRRDTEAAKTTQALAPSRNPRDVASQVERGVKIALQRFRHHRDASSAAEAVTVASMVRQPELAADAAAYLIYETASLPPQLLRYARRALEPRPTAIPSPSTKVEHANSYRMIEKAREAVVISKSQLKLAPSNPLAWLDLSRAHSILGNNIKARRAMLAAIRFGPQSRLILRAAARLEELQGDPEAALARLRRRPHEGDPWILASELAYSTQLGVAPSNVRTARTLLNSGNLAPFHLSELGAALGTLEIMNGRDRRARQLFRQSLVQPTRNTISQSSWAFNKYGLADDDEVSSILEAVTADAAEANFHRQVLRGQWEKAVLEARRWLDGEPFNSQGAVMGASVAGAALDNWSQAEDFLSEELLRSHSYQPQLLLSTAYIYGSNNRIIRAARTLAMISRAELTESQAIVYTANIGLLEYRKGNLEVGRELYIEAARRAKTEDRNTPGIYRSALAHHLREETMIGGPAIKTLKDQISATKPALTSLARVIEPLIERLLRG